MTALHFRKASEKDYPGVERLARALHALHAAARPDFFLPLEQVYTADVFRKLLRTDGTELHVAVDADGGVAAYALLVFRQTAAERGVRQRFFCNIDELCVAPERRRQGLGRAFFRYLENRARMEGACSLELTEWTFNRDAAVFYEEMGLLPRVCKLEKKL